MSDEHPKNVPKFEGFDPKAPVKSRRTENIQKLPVVTRRGRQTPFRKYGKRPYDQIADHKTLQLSLDHALKEANRFAERKEDDLEHIKSLYRNWRNVAHFDSENAALNFYFSLLKSYQVDTLEKLSRFFRSKSKSTFTTQLRESLAKKYRPSTLKSYRDTIKRFHRYLEVTYPNNFPGLASINLGNLVSQLPQLQDALTAEDFKKAKSHLKKYSPYEFNDKAQLVERPSYEQLLLFAFLYAAFYLGGRTKTELLSIRIENLKFGDIGQDTLIYHNQATKSDIEVPVLLKPKRAIEAYVKRKNQSEGRLFDEREVQKALNQLQKELKTTVPITAERLRPLVFEEACKQCNNDFWKVQATMMCSSQTLHRFFKRKMAGSKPHELKWGSTLILLRDSGF